MFVVSGCQLLHGLGEVLGWDLRLPTDERLQHSIVDEAILVLHTLHTHTVHTHTVHTYTYSTYIYMCQILGIVGNASDVLMWSLQANVTYVSLHHLHSLLPESSDNVCDVHHTLLPSLLQSYVHCQQGACTTHSSTEGTGGGEGGGEEEGLPFNPP